MQFEAITTQSKEKYIHDYLTVLKRNQGFMFDCMERMTGREREVIQCLFLGQSINQVTTEYYEELLDCIIEKFVGYSHSLFRT